MIFSPLIAITFIAVRFLLIPHRVDRKFPEHSTDIFNSKETSFEPAKLFIIKNILFLDRFYLV